MSAWRAFPESSWRVGESGALEAAASVGVGPYLASYAVDTSGPYLLNGELFGRLEIPDWQDSGAAGLICRADDLWSFLALYIYSPEPNSKWIKPILASYRDGHLRHLAMGRQKLAVTNNRIELLLRFISGHVRGIVSSGGKDSAVEVISASNPFPGQCGVVRFYDAFVRVLQLGRDDRASSAAHPYSHSPGADYRWDAFMSHAGADKARVKEVVRVLRDAKLTVWLDEEQIHPGDRVTEKIEEGLAHSKRVVVCLSPQLGRSNWVRSEYGPYIGDEIARQGGARVIPLVIETVAIENIPVLLRDKLRVDFGSSDEMERFLRVLRS